MFFLSFKLASEFNWNIFMVRFFPGACNGGRHGRFLWATCCADHAAQWSIV